MTRSGRRAAAVLAVLAAVGLALGGGLAAAGPVSGATLTAGPVVAAQAPADAEPAVSAVQTIAERGVARTVATVRAAVHVWRGWTAATLEVLVTALLLLCIVAWQRGSVRTESVPQRAGAPRSPPRATRS